VGDEICLVFGLWEPAVGEEVVWRRVVGNAYVHGIMDGEAAPGRGYDGPDGRRYVAHDRESWDPFGVTSVRARLGDRTCLIKAVLVAYEGADRWYRCAVNTTFISLMSRCSAWTTTLYASNWFTVNLPFKSWWSQKDLKFFLSEDVRLGDKTSLWQDIYYVSGIPVKALRGSLLADSSVSERMTWMDKPE